MTALMIRDSGGQIRQVDADEVIRAARAELVSRWNGQDRQKLHGSKDAQRTLEVLLRGRKSEHFGVLFLTARLEVIEWREMFHGTIDAAMVYPREIVRAAIELNACRVILAHNHPSGNPDPSQADHFITEKVRKALAFVDVSVVDHVVVGATDSYSFSEHRVL